jgi:hypothetical protein
MNDWFATDSFAGEDKFVHLLLGMLLAILVRQWIPAGWQLLMFWAVVLGWEVFEFVRFLRWHEKGAPLPWPWATDRLSWRDVAAGGAGGLLAVLLGL